MKTKFSLIFLLLFTFISTALADTVPVDLGGFLLSISDSPTAQVFHIVDQLAEWDQYAHKQYVRWAAKSLNLDPEDRELLRKHAELRRARGWNHGFEQSFLVDDSIEDATTKAIASQQLTVQEALTEKEILLHFAPKFAGLMEQRRREIAVFQEQLEKAPSRLTGFIAQLRRFAESVGTVKVPVFLVANAEEQNGGGEANGGRLVIEVPSADPMGFLLHESMHSLLASQVELIKATAASAGMNWQSLNEGIAYALAPGMTDDIEQRDLLVEQLTHYLLTKTPTSDSYVQFYMVAAVIRPVLRGSLARGETINNFLPKAVNEWRRISGGNRPRK